jgi:hypothetical protein
VKNSYRCLVNELMRLLLAKELFTFVIEAGVSGTNNQSERELCPMSQAPDTGCTNKKPRGADLRASWIVLEGWRLPRASISPGFCDC